jgi:hypothetical protein
VPSATARANAGHGALRRRPDVLHSASCPARARPRLPDTPRKEADVSNIQFDIEWTEAAARKIERLMPKHNAETPIALPPIECLPMEGDVLFLGPQGKQQPFVVAERQYHHEGEADWTIVLILDVPDSH